MKLGADNQEMELKRKWPAKIEIAEYMKTAPDLMDENGNLIDRTG
jgi:cytochrome c oxidase cbb3-type subunit 3